MSPGPMDVCRPAARSATGPAVSSIAAPVASATASPPTSPVTSPSTAGGAGPASWHDAWHDARRVLCVRLDSLGDVLMCTPALRALRQALPGRRLTLLTSPSGIAAAESIPELDAALAFAAPWMKHPHAASPELLHALAAQLAGRDFDGAVIFTSYSQSPLPAAMLCHLAGIPLRLASCRENPYTLLTHWVPEPERERATRHEVRRQLDLVAAIGCTAADTRLSFTVAPHARRGLDARLAAAGIDGGQPLLVLHPGASAPSRRYPARLWPALLRELAMRLDTAGMPCQLLLTGDAGEAAGIAAMIADANAGAPQPGTGIHSLAGRLTLPELAALLQRARLVVANNTGPAHIAAAVGTPVVSLYALTNPQHRPWRVAQRLLFHPVACRGCLRSVCPEGHHACLAGLAPETIADAVLDLLGAAPQRPAYTADAADAAQDPALVFTD